MQGAPAIMAYVHDVCRTSNSGARDFQDLLVDGLPLYRRVAERAALIASIQQSLLAESQPADRAWAWVHAPHEGAPFAGDSPLYFMLEKGLPGLREVARMLVRESEPR